MNIKNKLNTFNGRLIVVIASFILLTVVTSIFTFNAFFKKEDALENVVEKIEKIHFLLMDDINGMHRFFEVETINPTFFETHKSALLDKHKLISGNIRQNFREILMLQNGTNFNLTDRITALESGFNAYDKKLDQMVEQLLIRGFKNSGVEGDMRNYAHQLETYDKELGLNNILQLRRHEKDFIIRQEEEYVGKLNTLLSKIKSTIEQNNNLPQNQKLNILMTLENYSVKFDELVRLEKHIGIHKYGGLKREIDNGSSSIVTVLADLVNISKVQAKAEILRIEFYYILFAIIYVVIGLIMTTIISKKLTNSISDLKKKITAFVESDFRERTVLPIIDSENEIDSLITNISVMEQHIVDQFQLLKQTNNDLEMLFYATSRDIRMPLVHAMELLEMAMQSVNDPQSIQYFQKLQEKWQNLIVIIDELGIITNIKSMRLEYDEINFQELIKNIYGEFESHDNFNEIIFSSKIRLENKFCSSPGLLRAIFRNIIENSLKYAKAPGNKNFIKVEILEINDSAIQIKISDNGIGIKEEHIDKIFDMFFRANDDKSGSGLGLYIVKSSLEKLEGTIHCFSTENGGTTFTIILPNAIKHSKIKQKIIQKMELVN